MDPIAKVRHTVAGPLAGDVIFLNSPETPAPLLLFDAPRAPQNFPGLSSADLYTYAGAVAIEHMGGPAIPFNFGRTDVTDGKTSPPDGRLPDAAQVEPSCSPPRTPFRGFGI